jgi:hypothetical protein
MQNLKRGNEMTEIPQVVNDAYLRDVLKLSNHFIVTHAVEMGNITRPRSYFLNDVLNVLARIKAQKRMKRLNGRHRIPKDFVDKELKILKMKYGVR